MLLMKHQNSLLYILILGMSIFSCQSDTNSSAPTMKNSYSIIPVPSQLTARSGQFQLSTNTEYTQAQALPTIVNRQLTDFVKPFTGKGPQNMIHIQLDSNIIHPEGYELSIKKEEIKLVAKEAAGIFYGLQSLKQLVQIDKESKTAILPCVEIKDEPRYSYRGLHLDVGRHFFPLDFIKKYIDLLAYHKMNRFHWHLTEDQGWRIEIKKYPKLAEVAAFRKETLIGHYNDQPHQFDGQRYGGFYTQEEVKEIVRYAQERFVEVIPEIEMPGHSQSVLAAYPELACTEGPFETATKWGVFEEVYCPTEQTFQFLEDVLTEVMALFPSKYIHIGGDECPKIRWKESAFCQDLIQKEGLKDEHGLQSYFIRRIEQFLNANGRSIIGWDEILEGGLAPNATVMSWRGIEGGIAAAKQQHDVIMTPTSHCYLDYYQSQSADEPLAIGGFLPLEKVYSYEPTPAELSVEEAKYVLGVQGNLWTEYIKTPEKAEYMTYPRACALAEVAWSPKEAKNYADFTTRLTEHLERLQEMGVNAAVHLFDVKGKIQSDEGVQIALATEASGTNIYYTLDGSTPTPQGTAYQEAIPISKSTVVRALAFEGEKILGREYNCTFNWHKAAGKSITLSNLPAEKYSAGGNACIVNGVRGSTERYGDAEWLGFEGKDFEAVIDLGKSTSIEYVNLRFFQGNGQWIYLPRTIEVAISEDNANFKPIATQDSINGEGKVVSVQLVVPEEKGRYLKIKVQRFGIIPDGKQGAGHEAWLFIDEIEVH